MSNKKDFTNAALKGPVSLKDGLYYVALAVNDENFKMSDVFKKQIKEEGKYNNSYIGFITREQAPPYSMENLPIYGSEERYITSWLQSDLEKAIEVDLRDKDIDLLKRVDQSLEQENIQDFGSKIGGARKDLWKTRGLSVEDLESMNSFELNENIKKSNIWPRINYQELVDNGLDKELVYFMKVIKDSLPTKPVLSDVDLNNPDDLESRQKGYTKFISDIRDKVMGMKSGAEIKDFYKGYVSNYLERDGNYVRPTYEAHGCITNRFLRASQKNYNEIEREVVKKRFCYTENEKILASFHILKYDGVNIKLETDNYNKRPVLKVSQGYSTSFVQKGVEDVKEDSEFTKGKYIAIRNRALYAKNLDSVEKAKEFILNKEKELDKQAKSESRINTKPKGSHRKTKYMPKQLQHIDYKGPNYRNNEEIRGEHYVREFNFKGGEFGNWLSQADRQANMNLAYESFHTLADTLNIKPEDISLGNKLSIAFGARGTSNSAAHYEPARQVINLTKMKGAGSLAHEWGHAMDDILNSEMNYDGISVKTRNRKLPKEHQDLLDSIKYKDIDLGVEKAKENKDATIEHQVKRLKNYIDRYAVSDYGLNEEQLKQKEKLVEAVVNDREYMGIAYGVGEVIQSIEDLRDFRKEVMGRTIPNSVCRDLAIRVGWVQNAKKEDLDIHRFQTLETDYYKNSKEFDNNHSREDKGYWASDNELFARAFACYVEDKASELGIQADFLTGHSKPTNDQGLQAYPIGKERQVINEKFDILIDSYKEKGLLREPSVLNKELANSLKEIEVLKNLRIEKDYDLDRIFNSLDSIPRVEIQRGREETLNTLGGSKKNLQHLKSQGVHEVEKALAILKKLEDKIHLGKTKESVKIAKNYEQINLFSLTDRER